MTPFMRREVEGTSGFRALARKVILNTAFCPLADRIELHCEVHLRVIFPGDGVVSFYPKGCRHFHASARIEAESFRRRGIPTLVLDGDCIDDRGDDFLVTKTRVDRFLKELSAAGSAAPWR